MYKRRFEVDIKNAGCVRQMEDDSLKQAVKVHTDQTKQHSKEKLEMRKGSEALKVRAASSTSESAFRARAEQAFVTQHIQLLTSTTSPTTGTFGPGFAIC